MPATVTGQVVAHTAGISEKITPADANDPNFAVFGGAVGAGTVEVSYVYSTEAGVSSGVGLVGKYDPNFSVT